MTTAANLVAAMRLDEDIDSLECTDELLYIMGAVSARIERMIKRAEARCDTYEVRCLKAKEAKVQAAQRGFMSI
jgi:hypothetical protein